MKIVLLQDEIYLPSYAGGNKVNRCLLEGLARQGHSCLALTRALTRSADGPNELSQFAAEMQARGLKVHQLEADVYSYRSDGVDVEAINFEALEARGEYICRRVRGFQPDWVLVADDKRRFMLAAATAAAPGRTVALVQTIIQLSFGPLTVDENPNQTRLMREARAIIVVSRYLQDYVREYGGLESRLLWAPVYGEGPFPDLARFDSGFVTMINPCQLKGVSIFQALAAAFPHVAFAAVPTWGADRQLLEDLQKLPNVRLLEPADNIEDILTQTRILLVPSLWPETFGNVVPEAMLRGIPVLASNLGGLPEAKLGVEYLLPVNPAPRHGNAYQFPQQDIRPWAEALAGLLGDARVYESCSRRSRQAALEFVAGVSVAPYEQLLNELGKS
jgi:hypothetical protein